METRVNPAVEKLIEVVRELGRMEVIHDGGRLLIRVDPAYIPEKPWPDGVVFEPVPERIFPPLDRLLTVTQAVELAHQMGAKSVTKWDFHKDIKGLDLPYDKRPKRFQEGVDVFEYGNVYFLTREAVVARVKERLDNAVSRGGRSARRKQRS